MKRIPTMALGASLIGLAAVVLPASASAATTAGVQNRVLRVTGDSAANKLAFTFGADATTVGIDVGEDGTTDFTFGLDTFDAVNVQAGAGDDEVRIGNGLLTGKAVTIAGGDGNDTLLGADAAETIFGGSGNDTVRGGRGNDTAQLGLGADTFVWDPGDGSDTVDGGDGTDALAFHGSNIGESIGISANGTRVRLTRDVAAITMDLGTVEGIDLTTLGGVDTVTVGDLAGTSLRRAGIDLSGFGGVGDGAADTVIADGTTGPDSVSAAQAAGGATISGLAAKTQVTGSDAGDLLTFDGGDGVDTLTYPGTAGADSIGIADINGIPAAFGLTAVPVGALAENLVVSGLGGADTITGQNGLSQSPATRLNVQGGDGNDRLTGGDGDDLVAGGNGDDFVKGGRGNDTAVLGLGNDTFAWDPGDGNDVTDGGDGRDVLAFNGSNIGESIALGANGSRAVLHRDVAAVTTDMGSIEDVRVRALGSADTVTVADLTGSGVTHVGVDTGGADAAADTVVVAGTAGDDVFTAAQAAGGTTVSGVGAPTQVTGSDPGDVVKADGGEGTDTVRYEGTAGADAIGIADLGGFAGAFGTTATPVGALTENLIVDGLDGADTIAGQNGLAGLTHLTLSGGAGDDRLFGGDGDDLVGGGDGNDLVDGNRGNDTVRGALGNDTFQWDPGEGSDALSDTGGDDTFRFNGSNIGERIALSAAAGHVLLTRDVGAVTADVTGIEHMAIAALAGSDTITVGNLRGTSAKSVDLDLAGFDGAVDGTPDAVFVDGTPLADTITVAASGGQVVVSGAGTLTRIADSDPALDALEVFALGGHDVSTIDPAVSSLINAIVDLGPQ